MNTNLQSEQPATKVFCGVQALQRRLKTIATTATDRQKFDEIYSVVEELVRLDDCLARLRYDRHSIDEHDIDQAIDRIRRGPEGGA